MKKLPKSRIENIVVQNLETEVLIYDTITNQAFCLNETSANVFNLCDGTTSFDELKSRYKYTDELIFLALDELKSKNLLDSAAEYQSPFDGMNRREVIRRVGFATIIALPVISSIVAPNAANAASGAAAARTANCQACTPASQCNTGSSCRAAVTNAGAAGNVCAPTANQLVYSSGTIFSAQKSGCPQTGTPCCGTATYSGPDMGAGTCTCD